MAATARTLKITQSTTQHITTLDIHGTSGVVMGLTSNTGGTFFTLVKDGGGVFYGIDYVNFQDCHVSDPYLYGGHNSSLVSGNSNVILADYFVRTLTDSVSLVDTLQKSLTRSIADSITLTETMTKVAHLFRTITDSITITENFVKSITRSLQDILIFNYLKQENGFFILTEDGGRILLDSADTNYNESISREWSLQFLDSINLIETFILYPLRKFSRNKVILKIRSRLTILK